MQLLSKRSLSAIFLLTICFTAMGQVQPSAEIKRAIIGDFYIQTGMYLERNANGTLADFQALAPQSVLLANDFTDYSTSNGFSITGNTLFSVMVGLQFSDKQRTYYKENPVVRLGFSYFTGNTLTSGVFRETQVPFDTLTSASTGQTLYVDSVTIENYNMNYSSEQLRFDGSFIYLTNPAARWSMFTGAGITAGLAITTYTDIYYSKYGRTDTRYANETQSSSFSYSNFISSKSESFQNRTTFGASAYVPLGIDFRIGKDKEFWKRTHLFYEIRPGINFTAIPELHTVANVSLQSGFGLRVSWD